MSAVVALVVLPSMAPDLLGLGCPQHLGHAVGEGHPHEADRHGAVANHHGPVAHHDGASEPLATLPGGHDAHDDTLPPPCTCVGSCPTSAGPPAPSDPAATAPAFHATVSTRTTATPERVAARRAPYTLPFATAPPLA